MKGLAGQDLSAKLPDIRMTNIGGKNAGVSPAEAAREIFAVLYGEISSPDVSGVLTKGLQDLQGGAEQRGQKAVEGGGEKVVEEVEAATEKLKGLFN